jgi:hypothetical protein
MQRTRPARLLAAGALGFAIAFASQIPAEAQSQGQPITICHKTGSTTNPWVFMTIDPSTWPEYQAQGDVRATSLADCQPSVTQPTAAAPTPVPAAPTQAPVEAQQVAPGAAQVPDVSVSQVGGAVSQNAGSANLAQATPQATIAPTTVSTPETTEASEVSSLPKSGGEPDRALLVIGCLAIGAAGVLMRRVARRAR